MEHQSQTMAGLDTMYMVIIYVQQQNWCHRCDSKDSVYEKIIILYWASEGVTIWCCGAANSASSNLAASIDKNAVPGHSVRTYVYIRSTIHEN